VLYDFKNPQQALSWIFVQNGIQEIQVFSKMFKMFNVKPCYPIQLKHSYFTYFLLIHQSLILMAMQRSLHPSGLSMVVYSCLVRCLQMFDVQMFS